jgi:hypothetical protein
MLKTTQSKVLAILAALGLGSGAVVTLTNDGCTVKPAVVSQDAGTLDAVNTTNLETCLVETEQYEQCTEELEHYSEELEQCLEDN